MNVRLPWSALVLLGVVLVVAVSVVQLLGALDAPVTDLIGIAAALAIVVGMGAEALHRHREGRPIWDD